MKAWQFWVSYVTAVAIAAVFWWGLIGEPRQRAARELAEAEQRVNASIAEYDKCQADPDCRAKSSPAALGSKIATGTIRDLRDYDAYKRRHAKGASTAPSVSK